MTTIQLPQKSINKVWLAIARLGWFVLTLILVYIFVAGLRPRYDELVTICTQDPCIPLTLTPLDAEVLREIGLSLEFYGWYHVGIEVVAAVGITLLAVFIFWLRSDERMGLLVSYALVLWGLNFMVEADSAFIRLNPGLEPPFEILASLSGVPFILLFYLFPNGKFVPRWTRFAAAFLLIGAMINPLWLAFGQNILSGQLSLIFLYLFLIALILGVFAQIYRYRLVSNATERQQTKWVIIGLVGLFIIIMAWTFLVELFPLQPGYPRMTFNLPVYGAMSVLLWFFPVTMVMSILRYRLWDIDVIIRRTLQYALLTGLLALMYFGGVVILQGILGPLTGSANSPLVTVLTTLGIAALFTPLRRRVQDFIDRRFFRKKYDAEQTLVNFASFIRDEVDMDKLTAALLSVVDETMQPEQTSLWLTSTQNK